MFFLGPTLSVFIKEVIQPWTWIFEKTSKSFTILYLINKGQKEQKTSAQDPKSAILANLGIAIGSKSMRNLSKEETFVKKLHDFEYKFAMLFFILFNPFYLLFFLSLYFQIGPCYFLFFQSIFTHFFRFASLLFSLLFHICHHNKVFHST